jgi:hypothetical protein
MLVMVGLMTTSGRLTPDVLDEFVRVEAPSLTVDALYSQILATFRRDGREADSATVFAVMTEGADHFATFTTVREWLGPHTGTPYLRALRTPAPGEPVLAPLQSRYELVLRLLFSAYRIGIPAGAADIAAARAATLGPDGVEGACEAFAQGGVLPVFAVTGPPATTVLGSGIAATACAPFTARSGPVVLAGTPPTDPTTAVESLPAAGLTLLLELGVVPRELDVDRLVRGRTVTWEHAEPVHHDGPACAHLDRGALLQAFWRRATADARITVVPRGGAWSAPGGPLVDATGTRAASAVGVVRRPEAWTAATVTLPRSGADPGLCLAAAPDGYGYRLGSADLLTVGWVGSGGPPRDGPALWQRLAERAAWLVAGLPGPPCGPTYRPAGLALPVPADAVVPIGDAALTRDALASQGTSIALSDACLAADPRIGEAALTARRADARERHERHLSEALRTCRHADRPAWDSYRRRSAQPEVEATSSAPWSARVPGPHSIRDPGTGSSRSRVSSAGAPAGASSRSAGRR